MNASKIVPNYLEKHRIGSLFEELMGRIVSDMPEEPLPYLIRIMQRKCDTLSSSTALRKSTGNLAKRDTTMVKGNKLSKSTVITSKSSKNLKSKPDWDPKTKSVGGTFDDLWENNQTAEVKEFNDRNYNRFNDSINEEKTSEEILANELRLPNYRKDKNSIKKDNEIDSNLNRYPPTSARGRFLINEAKKKRLASLNKKKDEKDSGIEEETVTEENAVELYENIEDLREAGIKIKGKKSMFGNRAMKMLPYDRTTSTNVQVSVCAMCAKVLSGANVTAAYNSYTPEDDTESQYTSSRHDSPIKFTTDNDEDDEFESVSQVTGPRHPVWVDDDNNFKQQTTPRKTFSSLPNTARSHRNDKSITPRSIGGASKNKVRQTWAPGITSQTDSENDERNQRKGWKVMDDDEDDDDYYNDKSKQKTTAIRSSYRDKTSY